MSQDLLVVPPARLGAILSSQRREQGLDLASIAAQSAGAFDLRELEHIERGRGTVGEERLALLADLYQVSTGKIVPKRSELVIDLDSQTLSANETAVNFETDSVDDVLEQYLALLYLLRDQKPGSDLTLREPDLLTLEQALSESVTDLERQLLSLMGASPVDERAYWLSRKHIIPAAGLLVGLTAAGSLVFVNSQADNTLLATPSTPTSVVQSLSAPLVEPTTRIETTTSAEQTTTQQQSTTAAQAEVVANPTTPAAPTTARPATNAPSTAVPAAPATSAPSTAASPTAAPTTAAPTTAAPTTAPQVAGYAGLGAQAESLIAYNFRSQLPGWTIVYKGDRQGYRGLTFVREKRIEIYIDPDDTAWTVAGVLAHEVGHAIDVTHMTTSQRQQWLDARGLPNVWWPGNGLSDFHVGAGDFAEAVAKHLVDSPSDSHHGDFTQAQLNLAASFLP